jgi:putative transposase
MATARRTYKYRLYPTQQQKGQLDHTIHLCRQLYNSALQERREAYRMAGISLNYYDQANQLKECKADECRPDLKDVHSLVLQDVLKRAQRAFDAFFRRVREGDKPGKPGYPRYQGRGRYNSITYVQYGNGWEIEHQVGGLTGAGTGAATGQARRFGVLHLSKIGDIKLRLHRPLQGTPKTVTIVREGRTYQGEWYACISCDGVPVEPLRIQPTGEAVGVDMGLVHFATLSTGERISNPRWYRKAQATLAQKQQGVSHSKRGSRRQARRRAEVARLHRRIKRQRADFQHKTARKLVAEHDLIVLEKLQIDNMSRRAKPVVDETATQERGDGVVVYEPNGQAAKSGLNKSILDAGWGQFGRITACKAAEAGRTVLFVAPQYTSQVCSGCGVMVPKELKERWHQCDCGLLMDRDENAARNILAIGLATLGLGYKRAKRAGSARRRGELQVLTIPGAA